MVRNESVVPHWISGRSAFWYRRESENGPEFIVIDVRSRARTPAFDHARLAAALAPLLGERAPRFGLSRELRDVQLDDGLDRLTGMLANRPIECVLSESACRYQNSGSLPPGGLVAPGGRLSAIRRGDNLYVVDLSSGVEQQLTEDGEDGFSWGRIPDGALLAIPLRRQGMPIRPFAAVWSPDARYLLGVRIDERKLVASPIVEWVPLDGARRPVAHQLRTPFPGDAEAGALEMAVFDVKGGRRIPVGLPSGFGPSIVDGIVVGWSEAKKQAFILARTLDATAVAVFRVDIESGTVQRLIEERSATRIELNPIEYNRPNVRVLGDGRELLWYSERSGWGRLYLYDAQSGRLKRAIGSPADVIQDIVAVDEQKRRVYVSATARDQVADPYFRQLHRIDLDGERKSIRLTEPDSDHHLYGEMSPLFSALFQTPPAAGLLRPDLGVFIDTRSTIDRPPVTTLRSAEDGTLLAELERADATELYAAGWIAPVRERVLAADGKTNIYAVYFAPVAASSGVRYPLIDAAYAGPQLAVAPRNFIEAYRAANPIGRSALARLGFAVVTIDARGTPGRGRQFRDAGFPEFTRIAVDDHAAAIRQLASRHSQIDIERVGVYGWSWGGTFAVQAMLMRPDVYGVAVAGAGVYDYAATFSGLEKFIGLPRYSGGSPERTSPSEAPANWAPLDLTRMAGRLNGKLLLVHGDLDENAPPQQLARLIAALVSANRSFDVLPLPGRTHSAAVEGYVIRRSWDHFVRHLQGREPPPDAALEHRFPAQLLHMPLPIE